MADIGNWWSKERSWWDNYNLARRKRGTWQNDIISNPNIYKFILLLITWYNPFITLSSRPSRYCSLNSRNRFFTIITLNHKLSLMMSKGGKTVIILPTSSISINFRSWKETTGSNTWKAKRSILATNSACRYFRVLLRWLNTFRSTSILLSRLK